MRHIWDTFTTPLGAAVTVFAGDALVACRITESDPAWELERIAAQLGAMPAAVPGASAALAQQAEAYFEQELQRFEVPLDFSLASGFAVDALRAIVEIPYGQTASYGEVAVLAGRPRAARAVGTACRLSPFSLVVPVHRVVRADGSISAYGAHPEHKQYLLELEGALPPGSRRVR